MITHLQTYFQKHYRWMFALLLVAMVIPFVFAYGPGSHLGSVKSPTGGSRNTFFGHPLDDEAHMQAQARLAAINQWLKTGRPPASPDELQMIVLERFVKLHLADSVRLPTPTAEQLTVYIAGLPPFLDEQGFFSRRRFTEFQNRFAQQEGLASDTLAQRIAECWRLDQISNRLGGAGLYLPSTLSRQYALLRSTYTVQAAILSPRPDASITVSSEEALAHYQAQPQLYRSSEARSGILYSLPLQSFLSQVTDPSEAQLQSFFDSISLQFVQWQVRDEKGNVSGAAPRAPQLADHREEALRLYRQARAARAAAEAVDTLVQKISADKIAPQSPAWDELIQAAGLQAQPIGPLAASATSLDEETLQRLFAADLHSRPFTDAFQTDTDGRFVLLTQVTPAADQPFSAVEQQVRADVLAQKQQEALRRTQEEKVASLSSALRSGGASADFEKLASAAGFSVGQPAAFTLQKLPLELAGSQPLITALASARPGDILTDISALQATVLRVQALQRPAFDAKDPEAQALRAQIERIYARLSTISFLSEWAQRHARG